jgi:caspase domain-containing protein
MVAKPRDSTKRDSVGKAEEEANMANEAAPASYRAVLIGIDDYSQKPLSGCVNDIDQIERVLLDRLQVPPARITRLTAPRAGASVSTRLPCLSPTLEELRGCLGRLAEEVGKQDAVFVYYSGHGSQVTTEWTGHRVAREALLPVDYCSPGEKWRLLYDFELNSLFARVAERASDLTVVLDCCHSAGATRDFDGEEVADRYFRIDEVQTLSPAEAGDLADRDSAGLAPAVHMLTAACRSNETAREVEVPEGTNGCKRRHGAFTQALLQILKTADRPLPELRWADVWPLLLDSVGRVSPYQNPQLVGRWERRLFGGPWTPRDTGFVVQCDGDRMRIRAGTLMGLTEGAELALYGPHPDLFPPLGSPADREARLGLARIDSAERASSVASLLNGTPELPATTRGRLVKPGDPDRLVVSLEPFDPALAERLASSDVRAVSVGESEAEANVRLAGGSFFLGDDVYGEPTDPDRPPLAQVPASRPDLLAAALRHYARYNLVLRFPRRCQDLPDALQISLLDCDNVTMTGMHLQDPDLPELRLGTMSRYEIREKASFAIRVENRASFPLHVFVFNCAGSGRVEYLGDAEIPFQARQVFWCGGILGSPFYPTVGLAGPSAVERLVIVGTTRPDQDLQHLAVAESFAETLGQYREVLEGDRDMGQKPASPAPPVEQWTAELVSLRICR